MHDVQTKYKDIMALNSLIHRIFDIRIPPTYSTRETEKEIVASFG